MRIGWKPVFYDAILPMLRCLGPSRCDAALGILGRAVSALSSRDAIASANAALQADWDLAKTQSSLNANVSRFAARDYPLDGLSDPQCFDRFDVHGYEHFESARDRGRGVIILGCHLGAYLSGIHWLFRRGVSLRLLAQRPSHVSRYLQAMLDRDDVAHPQSGFSLRRRMPAGEGAGRLVRARAALKDGLAVYVCGDIPWPSSQARTGRFLGQDRPFQAVWADLAEITGAAIVPIFSHHEPNGRYAITFEPPFPPDPKTAVPRYLKRLEAEILARPSEAVAYLTWPCYRGEVRKTPARRALIPA